jgi:hypothetical protein
MGQASEQEEGMMGKHTLQDRDGFISIPALGLQITYGRTDPEYGSQLFVTVNTEEVAEDDQDEAGTPVIAVHLNDATLYDREKPA